jgi:SAM-dependent methyltransferase
MGVIYNNEKHYLAAMPPGRGLALDLGGGIGRYRAYVEHLGYTYINLDIDTTVANPHIVADAHALPFRDGAFALIISYDSLEHMHAPWIVADELRRCLQTGGSFVANVPFLTPFHGSDYYRYTHLGFRSLFSGFNVSVTNHTHLFTILTHFAAMVFSKLKIPKIGGILRNAGSVIDGILCNAGFRLSSYAHSYLVVAKKHDVSEVKDNG